MSIEPPTHVLLAAFLGYKGGEVRAEDKVQHATDAEVSARILPFVKAKQPAPQWMKNSPGLQKAFTGLRTDQKGA